eukprot:TRINITY_DN55791_c0_g1_i1.p1 TRINITY_DN55791_c0_g1~~TRINITY_DN55791_c0_g1_i1.p1  ORF type:complete len:705 (+),score=29.97 TRINITY_DN55791_c0_g1_i1:35-2149(+)
MHSPTTTNHTHRHEQQSQDRQERQQAVHNLRRNRFKSIKLMEEDAHKLRSALKAMKPSFDTHNQLILPNGDVYTGEWRRGVPHGHGELLKKENGNRYVGEWNEGHWHGHGTLYDAANTERYRGEWVDGQRHGYGVHNDGHGGTYKGRWMNNRMCGNGRLHFRDGSVYDGEFADNILHGNGKFSYFNGDTYEGEWREGMQWGRGLLEFAESSDFYDGEWVMDNKEGYGRYVSADFTYVGEWKKDTMQGKGTYTYASGDCYEGEWHNNVEHGKGKHYFADGGFYEGDWAHGQRTGWGVYQHSDKESYKGEWANNCRHGSGIYKYASGASYSGEWENDLQHGNGVYTYATGKQALVVFHLGKLISKTPINPKQYPDRQHRHTETSPSKQHHSHSHHQPAVTFQQTNQHDGDDLTSLDHSIDDFNTSLTRHNSTRVWDPKTQVRRPRAGSVSMRRNMHLFLDTKALEQANLGQISRLTGVPTPASVRAPELQPTASMANLKHEDNGTAAGEPHGGESIQPTKPPNSHKPSKHEPVFIPNPPASTKSSSSNGSSRKPVNRRQGIITSESNNFIPNAPVPRRTRRRSTLVVEEDLDGGAWRLKLNSNSQASAVPKHVHEWHTATYEPQTPSPISSPRRPLVSFDPSPPQTTVLYHKTQPRNSPAAKSDSSGSDFYHSPNFGSPDSLTDDTLLSLLPVQRFVSHSSPPFHR